MSAEIARLTARMIEYENDCIHRINHFLKVYSFSKTISELESLDKSAQLTLEAAALVHDIGIRVSLEKHGSADGSFQQTEGPPIAEKMLEELAFSPDIIQRVCYLVSRHHTYTDIDGLDYQILVEADFLVNIFEGEMDISQIKSVRENIFKTKTGISILDSMYIKG